MVKNYFKDNRWDALPFIPLPKYFQRLGSLKKLASQTAIYGLSSILGRLLNFALTPIHTDALPKDEYGQNTDVYAMIMFLMVIITFGMETAFFRFQKEKEYNKSQVFSAATSWVIALSLIMLMAVLSFIDPLADLLQYNDHPEYLIWMVFIVSIDAISAVPFAKLRAENKAFRFVMVRLTTTGIIVLCNLLFFKLFPLMEEKQIATGFLDVVYNKDLGVAYIFISNLIGNGILLLLFMPDLIKIDWKLNIPLLKKMLIYASPLVIAGLPGIVNEVANRQFLKFLLPEKENFEALGIFGANIKIATFMMLFIQAFRFAAEPFFFSGEGDFKEKMGRVMRYFVIIQAIIFLGLVCFIEVIKWTHFIDEKYWEGLSIVPILVFANLLLGINFNLNIWYKLKNLTRMGAYITFAGLIVTVITNLILIPRYGYIGAAWATLISYATMTAFSYYLNQKYDKTDYPLKTIGFHLGVSLILAYLSFYVFDSQIFISSLFFILYLTIVWFTEGKKLIHTFKK